MSAPVVPIRLGFAALLLGAAVVFSATAGAQPALRGKPSKDEILKALAPTTTSAPRSRGLSLESSAQDPAAQKAAAPAEKPQARAVDLEIPFDFNSDRVTDDGREVLVQLGQALNAGELQGVKNIVLEGHTDAKGTPAYNKLLSLRRAQSVRTFLANKANVPAGKLKAVGKGSTELADPSNPEDGVNRRVRVIVDF